MTQRANGFAFDFRYRKPLPHPLAILPDAARGGACSSCSRFGAKAMFCSSGLLARHMHKKEVDEYEKENPDL